MEKRADTVDDPCHTTAKARDYVFRLRAPVTVNGPPGSESPASLSAGEERRGAVRADRGKHGLLVTGSSDFHGAAKPGVLRGTGRDGNRPVPRE